jgi:4-nitrophenyl phosphatase
VLWHQKTPIEGAKETIQHLRDNGKQIFFVTNNSTRTREDLFKHAQELEMVTEGITVENFYPVSYATAFYCKNHLNSKKAFVVGMKGLIQEMKNFDIEVVEVPEDLFTNSRLTEDEFAKMEFDSTIDTVVLGGKKRWSFRQLCYISLLIRNGADLVTSNPDHVHPACASSRNMPACGSFMTACQYASGKDSIIIGKPSSNLIEMMLEDHNLIDKPREKFLMIGDNFLSDMMFAKNTNIDGMLVFTGVTKESEVEKLEQQMGFKPKHVMQSVKYLVG